MTQNDTLVLVIDDDEDTREILKRILESKGYRVETAADGLAAWQYVSRRCFQPQVSGLKITCTPHPTEFQFCFVTSATAKSEKRNSGPSNTCFGNLPRLWTKRFG